jgi:hypothetical protein
VIERREWNLWFKMEKEKEGDGHGEAIEISMDLTMGVPDELLSSRAAWGLNGRTIARRPGGSSDHAFLINE